MGTDFPSYIQRFELILFFAGYPLLYTLASRMSQGRKLLPAAYAMVGTLFLSFLLWHASPSGSATILGLRCWGVLAMLFWIPRLRRRPVLSLLHSLIFFALMAADLFRQQEQVANDMRIISLSLLLNATVFALVLLVVFIRSSIRRRPGV